MASSEHDGGKAANGLIGGLFSVDAARPLQDGGGGLPAFAIRDRQGDRSDLIGVQVRPDAPARGLVLHAFVQANIPGVLMPVALGASVTAGGRRAQFVIGQAPPGPSLAASIGARWSEAVLLERLLRPAAAALEAMRQQGVTHRAIRPDNVFADPNGGPVRLGQFWAAPPASAQPVLFEPPYVGMCSPQARGDGRIADDIYALGVLLLTLALGRLPLAELDDAAILERKLAFGSFEAMAGEERLPPAIGDLVRGMLAEDPDHRPPPELLADPAAARSRRVASRPPQRASRPLQVGRTAVSDVRTLAYALGGQAEESARLLRAGVIERWIRRGVGDSGLATRVQELSQEAARSTDEAGRADAMLVMRTVATLDPLAPLCWRGLAFWPDAIGPMVAAAPQDNDADTRLDEIVHGEIAGTWAAMRPERGGQAELRLSARQHRAWARLPAWSGGRSRLKYALNPTMACASPRLEGQAVWRIADIVEAVEATMRPGTSTENPVDREIAAFIAARVDQRLDGDIALLHQAGHRSEPTGKPSDRAGDSDGPLALLRVLAGLQARFAPESKLMLLAAFVARSAAPLLQTWRHRRRRTQLGEALEAAAASGNLPTILAMLDDPVAREADARDARAAERAVREIDKELARIAAAAPARAETALRIGTELAASVGAAALLAVIIAVAVA